MRICERTVVAASPEAVWELISDPDRQLELLAGVTRWESTGEHERGLGARFRMLMQVGSAEVGGLIEIVEHVAPRDLAWTSVTGLDQRGRWRLRPVAGGRVQVQLRLSYGVAGAGLGGWIAEHAAAPMVRRNMRDSLRRLAQTAEREQPATASAR